MENINQFKKQLQSGAIQTAYRELMEYIMGLRTHFINRYPGSYTAGSLHQGYLDVTYFHFTPTALLKNEKLKILVAFNYAEFKFAVALVGQNKQVQQKYRAIFENSDWSSYPLSPASDETILLHIVADNPGFDNPQELTAQIETGVMEFIRTVESVFE